MREVEGGGKKGMDAGEYLRGRCVEVGRVLGDVNE